MQTSTRKQSGSVFLDIKILGLIHWFGKNFKLLLKFCLWFKFKVVFIFQDGSVAAVIALPDDPSVFHSFVQRALWSRAVWLMSQLLGKNKAQKQRLSVHLRTVRRLLISQVCSSYQSSFTVLELSVGWAGVYPVLILVLQLVLISRLSLPCIQWYLNI